MFTLLGFERAVRRTTLHLSPGTYTAAYWTWNERASNFVLYDTETSINIEASFQRTEKYLDLSTSSSGLPYTIDFQTMEQIRHSYNSRRKIQRCILPTGSSLQSLLAIPSSSVLSLSKFHSSNLAYSSSTSLSTTAPSMSSIPHHPISIYGSTNPHYVGSSPPVGGHSSLSVGPGLMCNHSVPMATTHMYPTRVTLPITAASVTSVPLVNPAPISSPPASRTRMKIASRAKTKNTAPVISAAAGSRATVSTKSPNSKRTTSTSKSGSSKSSSSGTASGRQAQKSTGTVAAVGRSSRVRGGRGKGQGGSATRKGVLTETGPVAVTSKDDGLSAFVRKVKWLKPTKDEVW